MTRARIYLAIARLSSATARLRHASGDRLAARAQQQRLKAYDAEDAAHAAFGDYKQAVREGVEVKLLAAADAKNNSLDHAVSLRAQADSLEVQAAARYTAACTAAAARMNALTEETI
jgi:hypothetical protein